MKTETNAWNGMSEEEREDWVEEILERWEDLREEVRETMASAEPEAEWAQYQEQDLYGDSVRSLLPESALSAQDDDESNEDAVERFHRHFARDFRLGVAPSSCAREWRCGGDR